MSEMKYYLSARQPFKDGTAYVERTGDTRVCVMRDGARSKTTKWGHWDQTFAERGDWIECSEDEAKSLVKASATLSESKGDDDAS